ncbi:MarR family winged helix-turn-helix transcriptional regulator [Amycolatopsis sp. GM8]|uniref:MarR family winged helix-turn-helix transcriptional regulator n=1 Tax=Amycolatopsis sp. GM8 TaxID=2896530 RepID=UPI001F012882|nr:MarR family transcriptional regulator [Amycolatopsis sp. GM8]
METIGFAAALVRLSHLVQRTFTEMSRRHELTPQQAQLLCLLIDGPARMSELSHALNLEKSSMTGLADRVQRRGLIARVTDEQDRRACLVELTRDGDRVARAVHEEVTAALEDLAAELEPRARVELISTVTRLIADSALAGVRR